MNIQNTTQSSRPEWFRSLSDPFDIPSGAQRGLLIALSSLLVLCWCAWQNGDLRSAWALPDVRFYLLMAQNRIAEVPAPFSARPLAPILARLLAGLVHGGLTTGFTLLAYLSLASSLVVVFWLITRSAAPRWTLLLVAAVPFWPQLLSTVGLPDPLYTALLAALLVAIELEQHTVAAALMLPLMLARESTWLTLLCLLIVAGRRLGWWRCVLAVLCAATGALIVGHLSKGGLPNPEHLSGGLYMAGKLVANFAKSIGVAPWSNVYPELCGAPAWQHALNLGSIRSVGVCSFSPDAPLQLLSAFLTVFGALPVLVLALVLRRRFTTRGMGTVVQFCALYGGISFLLAPILGTWYTRLLGYGWPIFLVALPRILVHGKKGTAPLKIAFPPSLWGALLLLQALLAALGAGFVSSSELALAAVVQIAVFALIFVQLRSRPATL